MGFSAFFFLWFLGSAKSVRLMEAEKMLATKRTIEPIPIKEWWLMVDIDHHAAQSVEINLFAVTLANIPCRIRGVKFF
jgi:hypothetical protein